MSTTTLDEVGITLDEANDEAAFRAWLADAFLYPAAAAADIKVYYRVQQSEDFGDGHLGLRG